MQDFKNLGVWQAARRLTKSIYHSTTGFPHSEELGLKAQMRRASISICSNVAEGCLRRGDRAEDSSMSRWNPLMSWNRSLSSASISRSSRTPFRNQALSVLIEIRRMLSGLMGRLR